MIMDLGKKKKKKKDFVVCVPAPESSTTTTTTSLRLIPYYKSRYCREVHTLLRTLLWQYDSTDTAQTQHSTAQTQTQHRRTALFLELTKRKRY